MFAFNGDGQQFARLLRFCGYLQFSNQLFTVHSTPRHGRLVVKLPFQESQFIVLLLECERELLQIHFSYWHLAITEHSANANSFSPRLRICNVNDEFDLYCGVAWHLLLERSTKQVQFSSEYHHNYNGTWNECEDNDLACFLAHFELTSCSGAHLWIEITSPFINSRRNIIIASGEQVHVQKRKGRPCKMSL